MVETQGSRAAAQRAGGRLAACMTLSAALLLVACGGGGSESTTAELPTAPVAPAAPDFANVAGRACSGAALAGWCWQQPLPQGNAIADTTFVDDTHGWAVGDAGSLLATADGGLTWTAQSSGTPLALAKVRFVDARTG